MEFIKELTVILREQEETAPPSRSDIAQIWKDTFPTLDLTVTLKPEANTNLSHIEANRAKGSERLFTLSNVRNTVGRLAKSTNFMNRLIQTIKQAREEGKTIRLAISDYLNLMNFVTVIKPNGVWSIETVVRKSPEQFKFDFEKIKDNPNWIRMRLNVGNPTLIGTRLNEQHKAKNRKIPYKVHKYSKPKHKRSNQQKFKKQHAHWGSPELAQHQVTDLLQYASSADAV